jgi:hypothetical protein
MDIKIIINSFIIIFILHIIILNINYSLEIGKKNKIENFKDSTKENSINFLTSNDSSDSNEEFKKKLLKYIQQDQLEDIKKTEFEKKNILPVEASNSYLSNNNTPNFESNVADISKFYNINYDNLDESQLKETSIESLNKIKDVVTIDTQSKQPCNIKSYGRESTATPDNWNYKDELPMNGGVMNGIVGFDSLESQFAIYNPNKLNLQSVNDDSFNNIPHDDLRKPIVYEN